MTDNPHPTQASAAEVLRRAQDRIAVLNGPGSMLIGEQTDGAVFVAQDARLICDLHNALQAALAAAQPAPVSAAPDLMVSVPKHLLMQLVGLAHDVKANSPHPGMRELAEPVWAEACAYYNGRVLAPAPADAGLREALKDTADALEYALGYQKAQNVNTADEEGALQAARALLAHPTPPAAGAGASAEESAFGKVRIGSRDFALLNKVLFFALHGPGNSAYRLAEFVDAPLAEIEHLVALCEGYEDRHAQAQAEGGS